MPEQPADTETRKKVTFRKSGKCHRGMQYRDEEGYWYLVAFCSCPGSMNGTLVKNAMIVCESWDRANCKN